MALPNNRMTAMTCSCRSIYPTKHEPSFRRCPVWFGKWKSYIVNSPREQPSRSALFTSK
jgi:hypothetical protein